MISFYKKLQKTKVGFHIRTNAIKKRHNDMLNNPTTFNCRIREIVPFHRNDDKWYLFKKLTK